MTQAWIAFLLHSFFLTYQPWAPAGAQGSAESARRRVDHQRPKNRVHQVGRAEKCSSALGPS